MTTAAAELNPKGYAAPVVQMIPLASIHESKSNPRKTFSGIEQLAEDVKVRGLLQPVLVRAGTNGHAGDYELVFGARRYRAAKLAKLPAIPAFVRELTDEQTLELQIVENTQRADVHPLEEADGYRRLHEEFKYSVEEIAAKVGKSRSAVYERIKLCALVPAAREAFFAEKLSASTALLVARIPDKELQGKAVKDLVGRAGDDPMSYRDAVDHVQRNYMLQLKDAPFSTTDATLVAKAGPCAACPKRTGNQRELFADVKSPDVCTDPACFRSKKDALFQLRAAKAKEAGQKILSATDAKRIFQHNGVTYDAPFVDLDTQDWSSNKTYREKLAGKADVPAPVVAQNPHTGDVRELLPRATFDKLIGKKPSREHDYGANAGKRYEQQEAKRKEERRARDKVEDAVSGKLVAEVEKGATTAKLWRLLAGVLLRGRFGPSAVLRRRGWMKLSDKARTKEIGKLNDRQLRGLVFELVLTDEDNSVLDYDDKPTSAVVEACKLFGVDFEKVKAEATDPTVAKSCPSCHKIASVRDGRFEPHKGKDGKKSCALSGTPANAAAAAKATPVSRAKKPAKKKRTVGTQ